MGSVPVTYKADLTAVVRCVTPSLCFAMTTVAVAGDGVALLYVAIILLVLAWVTVSMRVCVRVWRKVLGTDDYLMVVGLVCIPPLKSRSVELINTGSVLGNSLSLHCLLLLWLWSVREGLASACHFERNQSV